MGVQTQALKTLGHAHIGFASVTEQGLDFTTPAGQLILTNLGAAQEFFSAQSGIHVAKAQRHRVAEGLHVGPPSFGYQIADAGRVLVHHPREAPAVQAAFVQRAAGHSYRHIAAGLNQQGFRTHQGNAFTGFALKDILRNPFYRGVLRFGGAQHPGAHEPLVSDHVFSQVQALRRTRGTRRVDGPRPLLQGRCFCLGCGNSIQSDRHRGTTPMYRERHRGDCATNDTARVAAPIDAQLGTIIESIDLPADWRARMVAAAATAPRGPDVAALKRQKRRLRNAFPRRQ